MDAIVGAIRQVRRLKPEFQLFFPPARQPNRQMPYSPAESEPARQESAIAFRSCTARRGIARISSKDRHQRPNSPLSKSQPEDFVPGYVRFTRHPIRRSRQKRGKCHGIIEMPAQSLRLKLRGVQFEQRREARAERPACRR